MSFGIICEYNPFHNGHLHQIKEIKRISDEPIVCVMSGNFTQRGEIAIADKYTRARMALLAGADAVFELPIPFCIASAEYFASAGVYILANLGVDKLCFGSESADVDSIIKIANIACSEEFKRECESLSKSQGNASAYFDLLAEKSGVNDINSNDILGIEYTKAIIKNGYNMQIFPIKREGSAYRETVLAKDMLPSASAIRKSISCGNIDKIASFVPNETYEILKNQELASFKHIEKSILLALRLKSVENLDVAISDVGLVNRILSCANESSSFDEFEESLQTKRYTKSAIRRAIMYILLGIKQSDLDAKPIYTTLLGTNERGREYLSSIRKIEGNIQVISKPASAPESRQAELSKKADSLYTMCFENAKDSGCYIRKSPIVI